MGPEHTGRNNGRYDILLRLLSIEESLCRWEIGNGSPNFQITACLGLMAPCSCSCSGFSSPRGILRRRRTSDSRLPRRRNGGERVSREGRHVPGPAFANLPRLRHFQRLFTNDTYCVVLTEFILKIGRQNNLPPHPFLLPPRFGRQHRLFHDPYRQPTKSSHSRAEGVLFREVLVWDPSRRVYRATIQRRHSPQMTRTWRLRRRQTASENGMSPLVAFRRDHVAHHIDELSRSECDWFHRALLIIETGMPSSLSGETESPLASNGVPPRKEENPSPKKHEMLFEDGSFHLSQGKDSPMEKWMVLRN